MVVGGMDLPFPQHNPYNLRVPESPNTHRLFSTFQLCQLAMEQLLTWIFREYHKVVYKSEPDCFVLYSSDRTPQLTDRNQTIFSLRYAIWIKCYFFILSIAFYWKKKEQLKRYKPHYAGNEYSGWVQSLSSK